MQRRHRIHRLSSEDMSIIYGIVQTATCSLRPKAYSGCHKSGCLLWWRVDLGLDCLSVFCYLVGFLSKVIVSSYGVVFTFFMTQDKYDCHFFPLSFFSWPLIPTFYYQHCFCLGPSFRVSLLSLIFMLLL